ncbi:hypothetical protein B0E33_22875 [Roseibium algicola]|uniref:Uncharacterized protein n=1 Tax=Roseibium algicola TaxID=2857014 RepID=A0ABM6I6K6_9HYPH|nr:hypothetical protein B0E33_22875 [Roseibium aggregatum]
MDIPVPIGKLRQIARNCRPTSAGTPVCPVQIRLGPLPLPPLLIAFSGGFARTPADFTPFAFRRAFN